VGFLSGDPDAPLPSRGGAFTFVFNDEAFVVSRRQAEQPLEGAE
jgi:hypothetical protein